MTQKKKGIKKSNVSKGKIVAGIAGGAALAAGAYYLLGPDGKKNQKKVQAAAKNIKKEILKDFGIAEKAVKKTVKKTVKKVVAKATPKKVSPKKKK
ncbi:MAG: hypothetical protein WCQ32_01920 [bacterium]